MLEIKGLQRFARQIALPKFGREGQERLQNASVLVVGAGGLGCPALQYLAAAGVGRIGIADGDHVEISNLHRQILFSENDLGKLKAEQAGTALQKLNPQAKIEVHPQHLTSRNALGLIGLYDLVLDGSDNFPTRYLVNDACLLAEKPLVFGSVFRFEGQVAVFNFEQSDGSRSTNYRDIFPAPPPPDLVPDCAVGGVLGVLPGIVGSMMASEAIKILAGIGQPLVNRLLLFDSLDFSFQILKIRKNPNLHAVTQLIDYEQFCGVATAAEVKKISRDELKTMLRDGSDFHLFDVREPSEFLEKNLGGENFPLSQISETTVLEKFSEQFLSQNLSKKIVLVCQSGRRSERAAAVFLAAGFSEIFSLAGGVAGWEDGRTEQPD